MAARDAARRPRTALVLSGGGARGAYQVGVLVGLMEEGFLAPGPSAIDVLVGSSAGSINAAALAAHADRLEEGVARLEQVWRDIKPQQVFRTDLGSLGRIGVRWAWDLSLGGFTGHSHSNSLLDTAPLGRLLAERIPFDRIAEQVRTGALGALAIIATDLYTANGVVFLQAPPDTPTWTRRRWRIERTDVRVEHLLASSAIPIFFPPVEIGDRWFSDGSIRNTAPLRPAINLGADRIIAIGVSGPSPGRIDEGAKRMPTMAQIAGTLLDAVMLDAIEVDVEHGERINTSVHHHATGTDDEPFRAIDILWLRPSALVREMAGELSHRIPGIVRYLMRGLGSDESVTELVSYLLFDAEFCGRLIDLGRRDVATERERIARFFAGDARPAPAA